MTDLITLNIDQNATAARGLGGHFAVPNGFAALDPMREELVQLAAVANGVVSRFRDDEQRAELLNQMGNRMFAAGARSHALAVEHQQAWASRDARHREPAKSINRDHDTERRSRYRGLADAKAVAAVQAADLADLAALTVDGNLAGLPQAAYDLARARFLELNLVEKSGLQAQFARRATLDDPLPTGPDLDAARAQAREWLDAHEKDGKAVAIHRRALVDYAAFLSAVFGLPSASVAFDRMLGRG